jgi:hypothetical protein
MKFMMLLKADKVTESGQLPSRHDLEVMGKYNEEMIKAGVMVDGAGLQPSSKGAKITFRTDGTTQVTDGPFAETKELLAGYWMIRVKSKEEAIAWAKKAPFHLLPHEGRQAEIELRQVFDLEDFPDVPEGVAKMQESFATGPRDRK